MPTTTTAINGCDVVLHLDNASGIPVDISGSANSINPQFSTDLGEYNVFGAQWRQRLMCQRDATIQLNIVYSSAANEGFQLLKNWFANQHTLAKTVRWMIPDDSVGSDDQSGEFFLSQWSYTASAGEAAPIMASVTLVQSGSGINFGTVAT
jgi:hypothetical protein